MEAVYRKSLLGTEEITRRSMGLPPRLRSLLIMIDGRRSLQQLAALSPVPMADALNELLGKGLVEEVTPPAGQGSPRPSRAASSGGGASAGGEAAPSRSGPSLETQRRDAVRALTELVGPIGEALAIKMEKASTPEALQPLLVLAVQVVRNTRGAQAAQGFAERFGVQRPE